MTEPPLNLKTTDLFFSLSEESKTGHTLCSLEMLLLNSNSYCLSQSFWIGSSQSSLLLCSRYMVRSSSNNPRDHTEREKRGLGLSQLSIKIHSRAQRQVSLLCALLCAETEKKEEASAHMKSHISMEDVWFVYFGDDFKAKLAAFTVVDLIANVRYAKVGINQLGALRCHGVFRRSVCPPKALTFGNLIVALLQLWVGWPKFLTCEKLTDRPKAILYIQPVHCTGSDAWQNGNSAELQNELWNVKYRVKNGLKPDSVCPA